PDDRDGPEDVHGAFGALSGGGVQGGDDLRRIGVDLTDGKDDLALDLVHLPLPLVADLLAVHGGGAHHHFSLGHFLLALEDHLVFFLDLPAVFGDDRHLGL